MIVNNKQTGLTLVEVLVAMILLVLLLAPALSALHTGFLGANIHADSSVDHYRLIARMETMLVESFDSLEIAAAGTATPSSYSDAAGPPNRILVYIAAYDADNADSDDDPFTGTDANVLWLRVAIEGSVQSLVTLVTR